MSLLLHPYARADEPHPERNGRKTLTTVQGLPKKFDQKKILKVIKKKFGMWPGHLRLAIDVRLGHREAHRLL